MKGLLVQHFSNALMISILDLELSEGCKNISYVDELLFSSGRYIV